ncbi:MAG: hypothetical protein IMX00_00200 [Limnochordales bacterium]|nr:hypothetical protein [Limnochordales bacterium]
MSRRRRIVLGLVAVLLAAGQAGCDWLRPNRELPGTEEESPSSEAKPDREKDDQQSGDRREQAEHPSNARTALANLLGLELGRRWEYEGEGNEFAAFSAWVAHASGNLYQVQEDSGGTVLARILELRDDGVYEIYTKEEHYSAESLLQSEAVRERAGRPDVGRKLLPWPLSEGSTWTLPSGELATLVSVSEQRTVPLGEFDRVVHVNIGPVDCYYAPGVGLIERRFTEGEAMVASRLKWTGIASKGDPRYNAGVGSGSD